MTITQHSQIGTAYASSCRVKTPSAVTVGSIKEFVINTFTGEVDYIVLKVDEGFLNLGSKLLALPFESFEFNTAQEDVVIVKESKETLENAPGFDEDHLPDSPQPEFLHSMRSYYSEESRSLNGRYDRENRSFLDEDERFDFDSDTIRDKETGHGFLDKDRERQSDRRRGGNPLL